MIEWVVGGWVRASKYELEVTGRGTYIRPVAAAKLEVYDPWAVRGGDKRLDRSPSTTRRPKHPPYALLANLLTDVPELEQARGAMVPTLSRDAERALLDWCSQYGLLGLTLHEIRTVTLPPRFEPREDAAGTLFPVLRRWYWAGGSWHEHESASIGGWAHTPEPGDASSKPLLTHEMYPKEWPEPSVEGRSLSESDWKLGPFAKWSDAFAPSRDAHDYEFPHPATERFWRDYGEPVGAFLNAIHFLRDVVQAATAHKDDARPDSTRIASFFNAVLDRVDPVIRPVAERGWETRYAAPSLLALLALMARDDLAGSSLQRCASLPDCGRLFRSKAQSVTYCSPTCRSREAKRRAKGA